MRAALVAVLQKGVLTTAVEASGEVLMLDLSVSTTEDNPSGTTA